MLVLLLKLWFELCQDRLQLLNLGICRLKLLNSTPKHSRYSLVLGLNLIETLEVQLHTVQVALWRDISLAAQLQEEPVSLLLYTLVYYWEQFRQ